MPLDGPSLSSSRGLISYARLAARHNPPLPLQVQGSDLTPGYTYVLSIFNSDYMSRGNYTYTLDIFVPADMPTFLHPYMSIVLGVTAAVILCLLMTLAKRLVNRYGLFPWRRRHQTSSGVISMVTPHRGVPPEIFAAFPTYPYKKPSPANAADVEKGVMIHAQPAGGAAVSVAADAEAGNSQDTNVVGDADSSSPVRHAGVKRAGDGTAQGATANGVNGVNAAEGGSAEEDENCCAVCFDEYEERQMVRRLPCQHYFHQACIDKWMATHSTCPICRLPLWAGAEEADHAGAGRRNSSSSRVSNGRGNSREVGVQHQHEEDQAASQPQRYIMYPASGAGATLILPAENHVPGWGGVSGEDTVVLYVPHERPAANGSNSNGQQQQQQPAADGSDTRQQRQQRQPRLSDGDVNPSGAAAGPTMTRGPAQQL